MTAMDENMYILRCEIPAHAGSEDEGAFCGEPAVNGFLCAKHTILAREMDTEAALTLMFGCMPGAKIIVRGFDAEGKEYRTVYSVEAGESLNDNPESSLIKSAIVKSCRQYLETAHARGVDIVQGPFAIWQMDFNHENSMSEM